MDNSATPVKRLFTTTNALLVAMILGAFVLALIMFNWQQPIHSPTSKFTPTDWLWWVNPIEENAFLRLPYIPSDLNDGFISHNAQEVWVVGDNGGIFFSGNGGTTWQNQSENIQLLIHNSNTRPTAQQAQPYIKSEVQQSANDFPVEAMSTTLSPENLNFSDIVFVNENEGYVIDLNAKALFKTDDKGSTWVQQPAEIPESFQVPSLIWAQQTLVLAARNGIATSNDGITWITQSTLDVNGSAVVPGTERVVIWNERGVYYSENLIDWQPAAGISGRVFSVAFNSDGSVGKLFGQHGEMESIENGVSWKLTASSLPPTVAQKLLITQAITAGLLW